MGLISFIKSFFKEKGFDSKVMEIYLYSEKVKRNNVLELIALPILYGGVKDYKMLQMFFPNLTRERLRMLVAKIHRIARKVNEK